MLQPVQQTPEIADILRAHASDYRRQHSVSPQQSAVLTQLTKCRTAALGGHVEHCAGCSYQRVAYNSCRNRHCPKCQGSKRKAWIEQRLERVLPAPHFHVVFTLPDSLHPLMLRNQKAMYALLFAAAADTLLTLASDPKRLGAQIGFTAVLHTWGQNLLYHPHLHCVVTGGGLSLDGTKWISARADYLLPVKVMAKLFRGKFLAGVKAAYQNGQLELAGSTAPLQQLAVFNKLLSELYGRNWVVYAKPPFGGAEHVYRYLGRYTHRVAITNRRLVSHRNGHVTFRWKDYADGSRIKQMRLPALEFIRRFLLHVLPKRFVRIRHYGLLASQNVTTRLKRCRQLLEMDSPRTNQPATEAERNAADLPPPRLCPHCGEELTLQPLNFQLPQTGARPAVPILDSS
jgi:hypothetical protein